MSGKPSVKLLLLDLDGTLIGGTGQVRASLWTGLEHVRQAGIPMAVCTGRPWGGVATDVAARLAPDGLHATHGGALVRDPAGGQIHAADLETSWVVAMVDHARRAGLTLEVYTPDAIFVDEATDFATRHAAMLGMSTHVRDLHALVANHTIVKTQWVVEHGDASALMAAPPAGCQITSAGSDVMPGVAFLTVTRAGVNKGSAAQTIAASYGCALADVMAIGDSQGDVPMLEVVGHPMIMGSATADLRTRFPVLPGVDDDGVLVAIEQILAP